MNAKELFQNEVLEEFRAIAKDLSLINNFSGLLMHQQKIQGLYEKFIFLKQLNSMKYQDILENYSEGSVSDSKKTEIINFQQDFNAPVQPQTTVPIITQEEPEPTIEITTEPIITISNLEEEKESEKEIDPIQEEEIETKTPITETENNLSAQEDLHKEKLSPISIQIADIKAPKKERILQPVKLDLNDSIAFISQLFNGSKSSMDTEINALNETQSIEESRKWIEEMFHKYNWKNKADYVERLSELIITRFA